VELGELLLFLYVPETAESRHLPSMPSADPAIPAYFYDSGRQFRDDKQNNAMYCTACVNSSVAITIHEQLEHHSAAVASGTSLPFLASEDEIRRTGE
jgi:hypothetical protein